MAVDPTFLKAYKKATGALVEKPGNASHSAKFDRCVEHVESKGGAKNAYAICTMAMGEDALKSMSHDDPSFIKEVETFMRTLGIGEAGPVPNSLLARQDLEGTTSRKSTVMKSKVSKDGSSSLSVWYHDDSGNRKCEVFGNVVDAEASVKRLKELGYKDVYVVSSQDDGMSKAGDKMYLIRTNGMEYARFDKKGDAEECLALLTAQGQFAVMIEETVVSAAEKAAVDTTTRQLNNAVKEAAKAEDTEEKDDLVRNIKNIQLRRQKATIAERSKSAKGNFKDAWKKITNVK